MEGSGAKRLRGLRVSSVKAIGQANDCGEMKCGQPTTQIRNDS